MIIRKKKSFENEPQQKKKKKKKKRKKKTISNYTSYKYVASQGNQRNEKLPARRVLRRKRRQSCRHLIRSNSLVVCNPNWLLRHLPHWKRGTRFCLLSKTGPGPSIFKLLPISHPRFSFHVFRSRKRSRATGKTNGEPPKKEFSGGKKNVAPIPAHVFQFFFHDEDPSFTIRYFCEKRRLGTRRRRCR